MEILSARFHNRRVTDKWVCFSASSTRKSFGRFFFLFCTLNRSLDKKAHFLSTSPGKVLLICFSVITVSSELSRFASLGTRAHLPQPKGRWLPSRTSGRAADILRWPIHLTSSSLNSDPSLNEGSHTQGTLGRQPCELSGHEGGEAQKWKRCIFTVQWAVGKESNPWC